MGNREIKFKQIVIDSDDEFFGLSEDGAIYYQKKYMPDGSHVISGNNKWLWIKMEMGIHPESK